MPFPPSIYIDGPLKNSALFPELYPLHVSLCLANLPRLLVLELPNVFTYGIKN
jgi:hypothetical protein